MRSNGFQNLCISHASADLASDGQSSLARSVAKWNRRVARLTAYIHNTGHYRQYCMVGNKASERKLGLLRDAVFAWDLPDSQSTSGGVLCIFGSHLCTTRIEPQFHVVAPKLRLFHWTLGLRLGGKPTLSLRDSVMAVLEPLGWVHPLLRRSKRPARKAKTHNRVIDALGHVPHFRPARFFSIFQEHEAVIKMIIPCSKSNPVTCFQNSHR